MSIEVQDFCQQIFIKIVVHFMLRWHKVTF